MTNKDLKRVSGVVLLLAAMHIMFLPNNFAQDTSAKMPAESPAVATELPGELDFNMDMAEFEDFGEEDFVVEEKLDPKTETAITAVKIAVGVVVLLVVVWLVRRLVGGPRTTGAG